MNHQAMGGGHSVPQHEPVFQISVVSRMVGIHQQTIRSYERVGLLNPARSSGNTRLFSHADVERLRQVVRLVNDLGINLAGVEVILRLSRQIEALQQELAQTRHERDEALAALEGRRPQATGDREGGVQR
ncbi:MAG: MerR family transcriptional regulator [Chloroflexi bacterium]|nr:MerR family transcriptional regulator [Chloroflexota bacterium]